VGRLIGPYDHATIVDAVCERREFAGSGIPIGLSAAKARAPFKVAATSAIDFAPDDLSADATQCVSV